MQRYTYISENPFMGMKFHAEVDCTSEYGEVFIEERNGTWNTPYLFNGKELDEEPGLYYYGARYLNPTNGMWLSTDPLFEKYVGMSPYNYCAGNPVKLVDPDGREL
jgi:RHS repeat-associated protein